MEDYKIVEAKGLKWAVRASSKIGNCTQDMLGPNEREDYNFEVLEKYSGKDKTFLDIGAHVGGFSMIASKLFGSVYSFEPQPFNFEGLSENIKLNNLANVIAINKGVGNEITEKEISARGGGSKIYSGNIPKIPKVTYDKISLTTIDSMKFKLPVSVIKIDTEGYEEQVLEGAKQTIAKFRPVIIIETHEKTYHGEPMVKGQIERLKKLLVENMYYEWHLAFKTHFGDEHLICIPK